MPHTCLQLNDKGIGITCCISLIPPPAPISDTFA